MQAGLAVPLAAAAGARLLAAHQGGLGQFTGSSPAPPPCTNTRTATPAVAASDYKAKAPVRSSLIDPGMTGPKLTISGAVIGLTCGNVKGATVELWHADGRGLYDAAGFKFRGQQVTDKDGKYTFATIAPGAVAGRAKRLNAKITVPGKTTLTTQLFFSDDPLHAKDPAFKPELLLTITGPADNRAAAFDFILNI